MFLSRPHLLYTRVMAFLQLGFGGPFSALVLMGVIADLYNDESLKSSISTGLACFTAFFCIFLLGIRNMLLIGRANRFNSLFMGSQSGALKLSVLSVTLGMPPYRCRKRFDSAVRQGLLVNCHLELQGEPTVMLHGKPSGVNYLVRRKTIGMHLLAVLLIGFSGFLLILFIFSLVEKLTGASDFSEDDTGIWLGIGIISSGIMLLGLWIRDQIGRAYRFSSFFSDDADGIVPLRTTAAVLGLPMHKLAREFDALVRRGYLCNCHLAAAPEPQIVLHNGAANVRERFIAVSCPGCGASNTFKVGFIGKCRFCGRHIQV